MPEPAFEKSIFINCPFDDDYQGILQAILFCIIYLGFAPRIATEQIDGGEIRLDKIIKLIEGSKYSIHDLSRSQSAAAGEFYRLNMPFELGLDFACRRYCRGKSEKRFLVLEEKKFQYRAALSDLSGYDVDVHEGDPQVAVRKVRNWLEPKVQGDVVGAKKIFTAYTVDFLEWYYEKKLADGFSEEDIQDYPTAELLAGMKEWVAAENSDL